MKRLLGFFSLITLAVSVHSSTFSTDTILVESRILNETRRILIFHHEEVKANLRVDLLYMLDGEWAGPRFGLLEEGQDTNPLIGIGIINTYRNRDLLPVNEADRFMDFIEFELIPLIEKQLNVDQRILYGHSFAGGFTINMMISRPGLFDKYIASSPTPIMSFLEPRIYQDLDRQLQKHILLYISYGSRDKLQVRKWAAKLDLSLSDLELENIEWKNEVFEGRNHTSSAPMAFQCGLSF